MMAGSRDFCAAYLLMAPEVFRRKAVGLEEAEDPDTSEGVRMVRGVEVVVLELVTRRWLVGS
jgi:hypothetical protein